MFIHILNTCGIAVVFSNMPQEQEGIYYGQC